MKILMGADLVPTSSNEQLFIDGNMEAVVGKDMKAILDNADFCIFNLELALTDADSPIRKAGPNLRAPVACINGYKALGVDKTYIEKCGTALLGYAECEVHRECLLTGIRKRLGLGKYEQGTSERKSS